MSVRKTRQVAFRLPADLADRLDETADAWRAALPGIRVTRTDVARIAMEAGLSNAAWPHPRRPDDGTTKT